MSLQNRLVTQDLNRTYPRIVRGEGVYLFDQEGKRYLDGCSGALVANYGHSAQEIVAAMKEQAGRLSYVYRFHFSTPAAEELAARCCRLTDEPMGRVYFTNSGSEAIETAVKLVRTRHIRAGESGRHKIVSRWQSYHGITMGALAWSGFAARRSDFQPLFRDSVHIPPAYCYRCWFGRDPQSCGLECAQALENAVLEEGPDTVAAFIAEPVVGSALAAAVPPADYFGRIREICDRHGILFIADEVMTGAGRTGGKFFASDRFPGRPDVIAFGKGIGGGYYPLAGAMINRETAETIAEGPGTFAAGQSYSGHPLGMAGGLAALDFMDEHDLLKRSEQTGRYLGARLEKLLDHPLVGDVRGMGMMRGLEFVRDRSSREAFDPELNVHTRVYEAALERGLAILPSGGCDRGAAGDMALIGPPLTISLEEIDELVDTLGEAVISVAREL